MMGRSVAAIVFGFLVMSVVVALFDAVVGAAPGAGAGGLPPEPALGIRLLVDLVAAGAGGFFTAWMAPSRPLAHVGGLAVAVALLGVTSAFVYFGQRPLPYAALQVALVFPAVLFGGWLRERGRG